LLVEDNPNDELLTRRTLKKSNVCNEVVVARDGAAALDYLFGTGKQEGQDLGAMRRWSCSTSPRGIYEAKLIK
jgi:two-component system, response regulator